jgi:hypothetical protein
MPPYLRPRYSTRSKYALVQALLRDRSGTLLDVGARDRVLLTYLEAARIRYVSCDFGPGHEYAFDLEQPVPLPDQSFDFVAVLDVLEHVEGAHAALRELLRLARRAVFVSLPNLNSLKYRARYLFTGRLNGKYRLLPEHQGDRHRWLPVYADLYPFLNAACQPAGFRLSGAYNLVESGGVLHSLSLLARAAAALNIVADGLFTNTVVAVLERPAGPDDHPHA